MYILREGDEPMELPVDKLKENVFDDICFSRCILTNLDMSHSSYLNCDFRYAETKCTLFNYSNFEKSRLIGMESAMADYSKANLKSTLIISSDFSGGSLNGADLTGSTLSNVNFNFCDLRGAILECDELDTCTFDNAVYDDSTVWSLGFKPNLFGAKLISSSYFNDASSNDNVTKHLLHYYKDEGTTM
ncbi:pentapeptide repeat-containing protein [Enterocloster citroniae]